MSNLRFKIKQGDREPALQIQIFNADDTPRNLTTGLAGILFQMGKAGATPVVHNGSTTAVNLAEGITEYRWGTGETDEVGEFRAEFVLVDIDGHEETYPKDTFIVVEVIPDVRAP